MKKVVTYNLTLMFDTDDDGADIHTATATIDNINEVLKDKFDAHLFHEDDDIENNTIII